MVGYPSKKSFNRAEFLTPFDQLFSDLMKTHFPATSKEVGVDFFSKGSYPKCDVIDYEDKIRIEAEISGLDKSDINIKVKDGILHITGQKKVDVEDGRTGYIFRELKRSSFCRSFRLGDNLVQDDIKAKFNNGILSLDIKKVIPEEPKVIDVDIEIEN